MLYVVAISTSQEPPTPSYLEAPDSALVPVTHLLCLYYKRTDRETSTECPAKTIHLLTRMISECFLTFPSVSLPCLNAGDNNNTWLSLVLLTHLLCLWSQRRRRWLRRRVAWAGSSKCWPASHPWVRRKMRVADFKNPPVAAQRCPRFVRRRTCQPPPSTAAWWFTVWAPAASDGASFFPSLTTSRSR